LEKTESGNVWLDPKKQAPYEFYQFWLNVSDRMLKNTLNIFTILGKEVIENLILEHKQAPHLRLLQKKLLEEITVMVQVPRRL
jgi:tyrosyl-tRNA synthetase